MDSQQNTIPIGVSLSQVIENGTVGHAGQQMAAALSLQQMQNVSTAVTHQQPQAQQQQQQQQQQLQQQFMLKQQQTGIQSMFSPTSLYPTGYHFLPRNFMINPSLQGPGQLSFSMQTPGQLSPQMGTNNMASLASQMDPFFQSAYDHQLRLQAQGHLQGPCGQLQPNMMIGLMQGVQGVPAQMGQGQIVGSNLQAITGQENFGDTSCQEQMVANQAQVMNQVQAFLAQTQMIANQTKGGGPMTFLTSNHLPSYSHQGHQGISSQMSPEGNQMVFVSKHTGPITVTTDIARKIQPNVGSFGQQTTTQAKGDQTSVVASQSQALPSFGSFLIHHQQQQQQQQQQFISGQFSGIHPSSIAQAILSANPTVSLQGGDQSTISDLQGRLGASFSIDMVGTNMNQFYNFGLNLTSGVGRGMNPILEQANMTTTQQSGLLMPPSVGGLVSTGQVVCGSYPSAKTTTTITTRMSGGAAVPTTAHVHVKSSIAATLSGFSSNKGQATTCHNRSAQHASGFVPITSQSKTGAKDEVGLLPGKLVCKKEYANDSIIIPFGWRRVMENGAIVYYSPTCTRLTDTQGVKQYLAMEGTCKCGLECPILVEKVFNFDAAISSVQWTIKDQCFEDMGKLCSHRRKILAMSAFQSSQAFLRRSAFDTVVTSSATAMPRVADANPAMIKKESPMKRKKSKNTSSLTNSSNSAIISQLLSTSQKRSPSKDCTEIKSKCPRLPEDRAEDASIDGRSSARSTDSRTSGSSEMDGKDTVKKRTKNESSVMGQFPCLGQQKVSSMLSPAGQGTIQLGAQHVPPSALRGSTQNHTNIQPFSWDGLARQGLKPPFFSSLPNQQVFPSPFSMHIAPIPNSMTQMSAMDYQSIGLPAVSFLPQHISHLGNQRFHGPVMDPRFQYGSNFPGCQPVGMPSCTQTGDFLWVSPRKNKAKRTRIKKEQKKIKNIYDSDSPPPNVDVSILKDGGKGPIPKEKIASFLENPTAFLEQQTAMVNSSISSTNSSPKRPDSVESDIGKEFSKQESSQSGVPLQSPMEIDSQTVMTSSDKSSFSKQQKCSSSNLCSSKTGSPSLESNKKEESHIMKVYVSSSTPCVSVSSNRLPTNSGISTSASSSPSDSPAASSISGEQEESKFNTNSKPAFSTPPTPTTVVHHTPNTLVKTSHVASSGSQASVTVPTSHFKPANANSDKVSARPTVTLPKSVLQNLPPHLSSVLSQANVPQLSSPQTYHCNVFDNGAAIFTGAPPNVGLSSLQQVLSGNLTNSEFPASNLLSAAAKAQFLQQNQLQMFLAQQMAAGTTGVNINSNVNSVIGGVYNMSMQSSPDIIHKVSAEGGGVGSQSSFEAGGPVMAVANHMINPMLSLQQNQNVSQAAVVTSAAIPNSQVAMMMPAAYAGVQSVAPQTQTMVQNFLMPANPVVTVSDSIKMLQQQLMTVKGVSETCGMKLPNIPSKEGEQMTSSQGNAADILGNLAINWKDNYFPSVPSLVQQALQQTNMNTPSLVSPFQMIGMNPTVPFIPHTMAPFVNNSVSMPSQSVPTMGVSPTVLSQQPVLQIFNSVGLPGIDVGQLQMQGGQIHVQGNQFFITPGQVSGGALNDALGNTLIPSLSNGDSQVVANLTNVHNSNRQAMLSDPNSSTFVSPCEQVPTLSPNVPGVLGLNTSVSETHAGGNVIEQLMPNSGCGVHVPNVSSITKQNNVIVSSSNHTLQPSKDNALSNVSPKRTGENTSDTKTSMENNQKTVNKNAVEESYIVSTTDKISETNLLNANVMSRIEHKSSDSAPSNQIGTTQVVLMPNIQMPLLQVLGANHISINSTFDKSTPQQQLVAFGNQPGVDTPPGSAVYPQVSSIAMPLNLINVQQSWNGVAGTNLTAMQIQTLQLQQQLLQQIQQIQGMQNLINQFNLQSQTPSSMPGLDAEKGGSGQEIPNVAINNPCQVQGVGNHMNNSTITFTSQNFSSVPNVVDKNNDLEMANNQNNLTIGNKTLKGAVDSMTMKAKTIKETVTTRTVSPAHGYADKLCISKSSCIVSIAAADSTQVSPTLSRSYESSDDGVGEQDDRTPSVSDGHSNIEEMGEEVEKESVNSENSPILLSSGREICPSSEIHYEGNNKPDVKFLKEHRIGLITKHTNHHVSSRKSSVSPPKRKIVKGSSSKLDLACIPRKNMESCVEGLVVGPAVGGVEFISSSVRQVSKSHKKSNHPNSNSKRTVCSDIPSKEDTEISLFNYPKQEPLMQLKEENDDDVKKNNNLCKCTSTQETSVVSSQSFDCSETKSKTPSVVIARKKDQMDLTTRIAAALSNQKGQWHLFSATNRRISSTTLMQNDCAVTADDLIQNEGDVTSSRGLKRRDTDNEESHSEDEGELFEVEKEKDEEGEIEEDEIQSAIPRLFTVGDLVWGQRHGFLSWPGKLVSKGDLKGDQKLEEGKIWVKWIGDHCPTQVKPETLKTLSEGLEEHHRAQKKHRKGRKMSSNLEAAIQEAMNELDRQTAEKMEADAALAAEKTKGKVMKKRKLVH
ncbi:hypothetical protein CHS0354_033367 [Potamilus streckersoni]|uniref:PWWP domain-containing protein n=1 Tax=Potamilus streckersoni TaxID=2493646 RepID=A0AAE0RTM5_9BIVA|nr:hypothetical protein CHS0354_033367 [Potamilus streckersoni]